MNLHAAQLKSILIARGLVITKIGRRQWRVSDGNGKRVDYVPASGVCFVLDPTLQRYLTRELRGNPARVAEKLEAFIRCD